MVKYSIFLTLIVGTVWLAFQVILPEPWIKIDCWKVLADDVRTTEKWARHRQFRLILDSTLDYLAKGDIRLRTAAIRVTAAGETFSPEFIKRVSVVEPARTLTESVAQSLMGHLRHQSYRGPALRSRLLDLEAELIEINAEPADEMQTWPH